MNGMRVGDVFIASGGRNAIDGGGLLSVRPSVACSTDFDFSLWLSVDFAVVPVEVGDAETNITLRLSKRLANAGV